ncbi:MATE family efflux transporter [Echinicola rosea]|uniref:Multidrug-efflux transporter n=1 Tax=Echinicola rosea TaxID=1807691 RepID=A0ABQ1VCK5_9BACT|nr:MATE family efflux transporter [Echinicola rosea]GGF48684.1 MATE family efflux transporter [Echinicola rosea]
MQAPKEKKYTEGKLISALVSLAFPIILANVLQTAYQLIDTFWLGRLGANAVAAVSVSFPILFLILSVGAGLTLAGTVLVSQHKGANNQPMVDSASSQTVFVVFSVSVLLAIVGYFSAGPLMRLIGAGPEIYSDSVDYFKVSSLGFVFLFMFFVFQSLMRGIGNVKLPVYVVLVTVLLNLVLDPLFIYGFGPIPGFGVAGAAVASVITQGLSAIAGIYIMWRGRHGIQIHFSEMKWDPSWAKKLFQLGFPSSMEQSARALGMIMMVMLVTSFGSETVAAYGVGARMLSFVIVPALGLAIATTTLVGQNVGAQKLKRAEETGLLSVKVAFFGLTGIGVLLFLFAENLVRFFVPNEPNVIADGALFIKIMGPSFGFLGVQQVVNGTFNGAGFTKASMFVSFLNLWIIRFPVGYYLAYHTSLGHEGIYWAFPISNWVSAIVAFIYFKTGYWRKRIEAGD